MQRSLAAAVVCFALAACGGDDPPLTNGPLAGNWTVTAVRCGSGPGPADFNLRITGGRTERWASTNGYTWAVIDSDATCTISFPYNFAYQQAGNMTYAGAGTVTCSPSADACASLSAILYGRSFCGAIIADTGAFSYTSVPATTGGTVTVTATAGLGDTCTRWSLPDPFSYVLTRE